MEKYGVVELNTDEMMDISGGCFPLTPEIILGIQSFITLTVLKRFEALMDGRL